MTLTKGVYNFTKWVALIFLPAAGTLYAALAVVWGWKYTTQVTNSVLAVDTFLGVLIGISSKGYTPPIDGHLFVSEPAVGQATARMEFSTHPETIVAGGRKYMTLAVLPDPGQQTQQVSVEMPNQHSGKSYD